MKHNLHGNSSTKLGSMLMGIVSQQIDLPGMFCILNLVTATVSTLLLSYHDNEVIVRPSALQSDSDS